MLPSSVSRVCLTVFLLAQIATCKQLRQGSEGASFISTLQFNHVLRVCNAYPFAYPLDVYLGKEKLTKQAMPYKNCGEFNPALKPGDKINFQVGDSSAGSFSVAELPSNDAVLVLIIYRHDTVSTGISFESHVFSNLLNAQVAMVDTYRGAAKSTPRVQDVKMYSKETVKEQRSEELRYDSVVAINPGLYQVTLEGADGNTKAKHDLVALNKESYMVMRCGVEAKQGQTYPEELMVFPQSDRSELGAAASVQPMVFALFIAAVAVFGA